MEQKANIIFPSHRDPIDSYLADLTAADPFSREEEIAAAKAIEGAEEALLGVILRSGVPLPELELLANGLSRKTMDVGDVARRGEHRDEQGGRWLVRRMIELRRLESRCRRLEADLASPKLAVRKRDALRKELAEVRAQRSELVFRIGLNRDRAEEMVKRVERDLETALGADGEAAAAAAAALGGRSRPVLKRLARDIDRARRQLDVVKGKLTHANLRLVVAMAKKFRNRGVAFSDLIQEGNLGLMRAVDKFDHRVGTRFSTYAGWWIKQSIARLVVCQGRDVRVPIHMTENVRKALRTHTRLLQELGRDPGLDEIGDELGWTVDEVRAALEATPRVSSIDTPVGEEDSDRRFGDFLSDESVPAADDSVLEDQRKDQTHRMLGLLSPRERRILALRFGFDGEDQRTLQEIGEEMGLSRERIRQLEAEALDKLRAAMRQVARPNDGGAAAA